MYCALKHDAMEFVRWDENDSLDAKPQWFHKLVKRRIEWSMHSEAYYYITNDSQIMLEIGDVFVRNHLGQVRYFSVWEFSDLFFEVD